VAMQLASGPQARGQAKGCDGQLTEARMDLLGMGCGQNFTGGHVARSRGRGRVWEGTGRCSRSGA
jgi:hypothetical protein